MSFPGDLKTPRLLLDPVIARRNIRNMATKAHEAGVQFRPHFKTHQSLNVGQWFAEVGVRSITVSSLAMARYFADGGWTDITLAFPFNIRELDDLNRLPDHVTIRLTVDQGETIRDLDRGLERKTPVSLKIDAGYGRAGIPVDQTGQISRLVHEIRNAAMLVWDGFLAHNGLSYQARGKAEVLQFHEEFIRKMDRLGGVFSGPESQPPISVGDTPGCSLAQNFGAATEIRPGNFVFYDLMQVLIGSCKLSDIAVALACPVVSVYTARSEALVVGGAIHLSKESVRDETGTEVFGIPVALDEAGWRLFPGRNFVRSISQEHGVIRFDPLALADIRPGSVVGILPVHSCLCANLNRGFYSMAGDWFPMMDTRHQEVRWD